MNSKAQFFFITGMGSLVSVGFNVFGILFYRAADLPPVELLIRFGLPALAYLLIYIGIQSRNSVFFDPAYFAALVAGKSESAKKTTEQYRESLEKIGSAPIKMIAVHVLLHLVFTGALVFSGNYLGIAPGLRVPVFFFMFSLGMLAGTFVYVMIDSLVSRSLIAGGFSRYPRELREGRQSLKMFIIPIAVALLSIFFAAPVVLLEMHRSGRGLAEMGQGNWAAVFVMLGIFFVCVFILAAIIKTNTALLYDSVIRQMESLSSEHKDLTRRVSICSVDELGTIAGMINSFCDNMQEKIAEIKSSEKDLSAAGGRLQNNASVMAASLEQVSGAAEQIRSHSEEQLRSASASSAAVDQITRNIESLESSIGAQSSSMDAASAAVEEMLGNINSINTMTEKMVSQFTVLENAAQEGRRIQKESGERIAEIVSQSQSLQGANKIISTIAAQTNLLAMNAAIEAAHAGDAGQGFAVVADEIRKLAENSSSESHNIGMELKQIVETINHIVKGSDDSGAAFAQVSGRIADTQVLVSQAGNAIREQSKGADQVMQALKAMNDITVEVKTGVREMSKGSDSMLEEVSRLRGGAQEISSRIDAISVEIGKVSQGAQEVSVLAQTNHSAIEKIAVIADGFEV
ncbi:MAG: methyl-accepting chemotaxis protein [Treponema sp.]|nr:methyl-accepting chemotaxis protein [Treponema sp.]